MRDPLPVMTALFALAIVAITYLADRFALAIYAQLLALSRLRACLLLARDLARALQARLGDPEVDRPCHTGGGPLDDGAEPPFGHRHDRRLRPQHRRRPGARRRPHLLRLRTRSAARQADHQLSSRSRSSPSPISPIALHWRSTRSASGTSCPISSTRSSFTATPLAETARRDCNFGTDGHEARCPPGTSSILKNILPMVDNRHRRMRGNSWVAVICTHFSPILSRSSPLLISLCRSF